MKAPRAHGNVTQLRQDPTAGIPAPYLAMAAAHMMKLGKQVFENQSPPTADQLTQNLQNLSNG
jgi:hypothetical protein